jgi:uncharacterized protein YqhQ
MDWKFLSIIIILVIIWRVKNSKEINKADYHGEEGDEV